MDTRHLVDAIVRQTTVLIAQLSTAAGVRTPLAQVADQVFLELARELEGQGIGRKVAADMFGLALRSYQKKITRLSESVTSRERTLWEAVLGHLQARGGSSRQELFHHFRQDGRDDVAAVLRDLVDSGLVSATGRSDAAFYEVASEEARRALATSAELDAVAGLLWLAIYEHRTIDRVALVADHAFDPDLAHLAIDQLIAEGRVDRVEEDGPEMLSCAQVHIPIGAEEGWEAAVFDHFRAMATAIAAKVRGRGPGSQEGDLIGGATLTFRIHRGHPHEHEVEGLLRRVRGDINALWARVAEHNRKHPRDADASREVTFYLGQHVVDAPNVDEGGDELEVGKEDGHGQAS